MCNKITDGADTRDATRKSKATTNAPHPTTNHGISLSRVKCQSDQSGPRVIMNHRQPDSPPETRADNLRWSVPREGCVALAVWASWFSSAAYGYPGKFSSLPQKNCDSKLGYPRAAKIQAAPNATSTQPLFNVSAWLIKVMTGESKRSGSSRELSGFLFWAQLARTL